MTERITIIPEDGTVAVNGINMSGLDLSFLPDEIHAIQWVGDSGEVEFRPDAFGHKKPNEKIGSLKPYEKAIGLFEKKQEEDRQGSEENQPSDRERLFNMTQAILDDKARSRGYDNIQVACTYAGSTVPRFAGEAQACIKWRDEVWIACHKLQGEIGAGAIAMPDRTELVSLLPLIQWPQL